MKRKKSEKTPYQNPVITLLLLLGVGIIYSDLALILSVRNGVSWGGDFTLFLLNTLPIMLALLLIWLMTGWAWLSCLLTGAAAFLLAGGNYFKLLFRDDPLVWNDLFHLREGFRMSGEYEVVFTPFMWTWLGVIVGATVILILLGRGRPKATLRLLSLTAVGMIALSCFTYLYPDEERYVELAGDYAGSETDAYVACGMLYPFLYSARTVEDWTYDPDSARAILSQYEDERIPADKRVSFITIQLEAFADFTPFEVEGLSPDVYAKFHALLDRSLHGTLLTDIFAGGTTETEWAVLTGGNIHDEFTSPTDSVAWYFRDQGYTVNGSHPSHDWFYERGDVNPNLGFEDYLFMENHFAEISDDKNVAYDDIYFPDLEQRLGDYFATESKPLFSFNVTYQGHGPYKDFKTYWGTDYCTGNYTEASSNILNNYFAIEQDTMDYVTHFVDFLNTIDKPIVLTLYGDHKPWLGDDNSVYEELGINLDLTQPEGFWNYYTTWYLVWANDAAKARLGVNFSGTDEILSPCFLMDRVLELCGLKGSAYMQAQHEVAQALPVLHTTGWYLENGELSQNLSPRGKKLVEQFQNLSRWDRENGRSATEQ